MSDSEVETERVAVRTYVPKYQRDQWDEHADDLEMSRSEFVRTMVQAGRSGFFDGDSEDSAAGTKQSGSDESLDENTSEAVPSEAPQGGDLESQVLDALSRESHLSWDELLAAVTDDIEDRLEDALQSLQAADRVRYSGRNGGYTIDEQ
jgi:hypothetical protein